MSDRSLDPLWDLLRQVGSRGYELTSFKINSRSISYSKEGEAKNEEEKINEKGKLIISWISEDLFLKSFINYTQRFGSAFCFECFLCVPARVQSGGSCSLCSCFFSFLPMPSLHFWSFSFFLAASLPQTLVFRTGPFKFFESLLKFFTLNFFSTTHINLPFASIFTLTAFRFRC